MTKKELAALLSGVDDKAEVTIRYNNAQGETNWCEIETFTYDVIKNEVYLNHA